MLLIIEHTFQGYCVAIYLVKRLSSDTLLQRLKQFGSRHADHTRALSKISEKSVFRSLESKAHVTYCDQVSSVLVRKLLTFSTSSPKPLNGFRPNLVGIILGKEESQVLKWWERCRLYIIGWSCPALPPWGLWGGGLSYQQ